MRRVWICYLMVFWILLSCACRREVGGSGLRDIRPETEGGSARQEKSVLEGSEAPGEKQQDMLSTNRVDEAGKAAAADNSDKADKTEVSRLRASVSAEEAFYKLCFAAGGQQVYVCGSRKEPPLGGSLADDSYFIGTTEAPTEERGSCEVRELPVERPDGMSVLRMAADTSGNCHLLWVSKEEKSVNGQKMEVFTYERSQIMTIDREGSVLRCVDISKLFAEKHGLMYCFTVDREGNYYVERGAEILRFSEDGRTQTCISCEGQVYGVGQGKSGALYCVCRGADGVDRLYRLRQDGGTEELAELPRVSALYPCVGAGTDTELILFYREGGIFTVDMTGEAAAVELRAAESEMPVTGQDIGGEAVLGDGRVCLYHQGREKGWFYYVPVGR